MEPELDSDGSRNDSHVTSATIRTEYPMNYQKRMHVLFAALSVFALGKSVQAGSLSQDRDVVPSASVEVQMSAVGDGPFTLARSPIDCEREPRLGDEGLSRAYGQPRLSAEGEWQLALESMSMTLKDGRSVPVLRRKLMEPANQFRIQGLREICAFESGDLKVTAIARRWVEWSSRVLKPSDLVEISKDLGRRPVLHQDARTTAILMGARLERARVSAGLGGVGPEIADLQIEELAQSLLTETGLVHRPLFDEETAAIRLKRTKTIDVPANLHFKKSGARRE